MNNNPQIRSEAASIVKNNLGKLILMFLAMAGMMVVFMLGTVLIGSLGMAINETVGVILMIVAYLVMFFLMIGLSLGYTNGLIQMARGMEPSVGVIFSRMSKGLPGLGLSLWVGLKTWLWMLPGLALTVVGVLIGAAADSSALSGILSIAGMILAYALMIPAAFRYAMSTYFFADDPDNGVFGSVSMSKDMMQGRKWQLFKLCIPYVLIIFVVAFVMGLLTGLLSGLETVGAILMIVVMLAYIVVCAYVGMLIGMANICFYEQNRG